jgi:hypothetical protein
MILTLAGHVAQVGEKRNACGFLVGKPEKKKQLGCPIRSWVDNIKMDHGEILWGLLWLRIGTNG